MLVFKQLFTFLKRAVPFITQIKSCMIPASALVDILWAEWSTWVCLTLVGSGTPIRNSTRRTVLASIKRSSLSGLFVSDEENRVFHHCPQIGLATMTFPEKIKGNCLDSFARKFLWDVGLDYAHGTGHGVGSYLCVHEGPMGISWRPYPDDPGLQVRLGREY